MMNDIETHPFEPFLPDNARLLMLGTFPPAPKRWCMEFYYPNFQNDMWRIFGLIFFDDKNHFVIEEKKKFDIDKIIPFLNDQGIAIFDTALRIRRTKNTASDKDLEIVQKSDLDGMLHKLSLCKAVVTAGQLATTVFADHFSIECPRVGKSVDFNFEGRTLQLYRMPSSSRAYPMSVENKAEIYRPMFEQIFK
jgi:G:T/U-mismatch repair DNA glycosylase